VKALRIGFLGVAWFFVRAPDGNIYVFQQAPD
jgi:hypothetical protein